MYIFDESIVFIFAGATNQYLFVRDMMMDVRCQGTFSVSKVVCYFHHLVHFQILSRLDIIAHNFQSLVFQRLRHLSRDFWKL